MSVTDSLTRWRPCWRLNDWNLPNQTYSNEPTKPNLPNHAYQTEPTKPNLPNYAYQNKPTKPNLLNKINPKSVVRAVNAWDRGAFGNVSLRHWSWFSNYCWIFAQSYTNSLIRHFTCIYTWMCFHQYDSRFLSRDLIDPTKGYFLHCTVHKLVFVLKEDYNAQPGSPSLSIHQGNVSKKAPHNRHPHPFCSAKHSLWYLGWHF